MIQVIWKKLNVLRQEYAWHIQGTEPKWAGPEQTKEEKREQFMEMLGAQIWEATSGSCRDFGLYMRDA